MNNMRRGFTMIELIFVIVIIGILAAVAIPKLAATRDDAKVTKGIANLKTCITDIGSSYTARGEEDANSAACTAVAKDGCFKQDATGSTAPDGNVTAAADGAGSAKDKQWCKEAITVAADQNLTGLHQFGGSKIIR